MPYPDRPNTSKNTPANMNKVHAGNSDSVESMIGPLQEFEFERLSSTTCIRLIKIHTELVRGDISCTLKQYKSDSPIRPEYIALSYVWGDSTPRHTVYINGLVCRVHYSLWQLLERNRTDDALVCEWFWTDLLCIDQIHHSEKNEQVSRMGDIYSEAKYVISWLGKLASTVEALRTLIQFSEEDGTQFPLKYAWKTPESDQIHKACDQLAFEEPYWERVWIMQEVACAKDCLVTCGDISLNFENLLQKMETAMNRSTRFDYPSDRDRMMRRIRGLAEIRKRILEGESMSILNVISRTSFCRATRDQDRIYGLLGLARRLDPGFDCRALEISYDKSLSDIWWDMVFVFLDEKAHIRRSALTDLESMLVSRLAPPRKHLELNGITSIRRTQAETACQVSEAVYSTSVQAFLGILPQEYSTYEGLTENESRNQSRFSIRRMWDTAMTHICDHPCLQTKLGRSTLAGLQFTSWHAEEQQPLVPVSNDLPSNWFCDAHLPAYLQDTTSKHCIRTLYNIKTKPHSHSFHCSGAGYHTGACDFSRAVLKLVQLGITCLVQRKHLSLHIRDQAEIAFYCDFCDPTAPFGK